MNSGVELPVCLLSQAFMRLEGAATSLASKCLVGPAVSQHDSPVFLGPYFATLQDVGIISPVLSCQYTCNT